MQMGDLTNIMKTTIAYGNALEKFIYIYTQLIEYNKLNICKKIYNNMYKKPYIL